MCHNRTKANGQNMIDSSEIVLSTRHIDQKFETAIKKVGLRFSLSPIEMNIIGFLAVHPEMDKAKDIAAMRGFSKASISQGLSLLSDKGLVKTSPDLNDRRVVHLMLTDKANEVKEAIFGLLKHCSDELFAGFSKEDKEMCNQLIRRMSANSENI